MWKEVTGTKTVSSICPLTSEPSVATAAIFTVPPRTPVTVAVPSPLSVMRALELLMRQLNTWATFSVEPSAS